MTGLVLSLFPGLGLLDQAFEEVGFCVVRGPDLLWGGDIRRFNPPSERFDGIIGGPPCQSFSGLGRVNKARWGADSVMPDMIPEFVRCISESQPEWFVMENVTGAYSPEAPGYNVQDRIINNRWCGGEQCRIRRFSFGARVEVGIFHVEGVALEAFEKIPTVVSTGQADNKGSRQRHRSKISEMARAQGIDPARFSHSPFTVQELRRAIANGVPLQMGRAVASAVKAAIEVTA